jgi:phosphate transport system substrate-binding protein
MDLIKELTCIQMTKFYSVAKFYRIASFAVLAFTIAACGGDNQAGDSTQTGGNKSTITVKGSDTMVQLAQRWAEQYMKDKPGTQVQVTGGGSGTGISALINGTTDICASSRPMKDSEKQQLQSKYQSAGVEVKVARDGITVFLNNDNPVKELTLAQIKDIYQGKITNWNQVGGPNAPIVLYGRENSSGTYEFFKEHVLSKEDFANNMQALPGTAAVVNAVKRDKNGIGFGGVGYAEGLKEAAIKTDAGSFLPTKENIMSEKYPISRYLFLYLRQTPQGEIKNFLDYILGAQGQEVIVNEGFFPVRG